MVGRRTLLRPDLLASADVPSHGALLGALATAVPRQRAGSLLGAGSGCGLQRKVLGELEGRAGFDGESGEAVEVGDRVGADGRGGVLALEAV